MIYFGMFISFFPGILVYLISFISAKVGFYKLNKLEIYIISLSMIIIYNMIIFKDYKQLIIIITIIMLLYIQLQIYFFKKVKINHNKKFYVMILIPILEEFIFRLYYIKYIEMYTINIIWVIVLNVILFLWIHAYREKLSVVKKAIIASLLIISYIITRNLSLSISIHIIYNVVCYLLEERGNNYYG